ncbi:MAG: hypothetical protein UT00_C0013G0019 [Parcubacteria group bacterium GW2011_GWA1_38_7]|nr:MAG: hypothetical protein UT00_C0013G0019 [Parcubacteria group bacterium GW2011_GWA1_38_7]
MKKFILLLLAVIVVVLVLVVVTAEIISFKIIKKTTDQINKDLNQNFQKIVRIPAVVPPSYRGYYQTIYNWEMETPQNEVIKVIFIHDTGFSKSQKTITATLTMEPNADASLFNKVLPAVISDNQALSSAQHFEDANLSANSEIGYKKISLEPVEGDATRMTKITWEFDKSQIAKGDEDLYSRLNNFPEPLLEILYSLQQFTIRIFSG